MTKSLCSGHPHRSQGVSLVLGFHTAPEMPPIPVVSPSTLSLYHTIRPQPDPSCYDPHLQDFSTSPPQVDLCTTTSLSPPCYLASLTLTGSGGTHL